MQNLAVKQLQSWGLSFEDADAAGLYPVASAASIYPQMSGGPAIVIPYHNFESKPLLYRNGRGDVPFARLRLLHDAGAPPAFGRRRQLRYIQPPHSPIYLYLPPQVPWADFLADTSRPLFITEGEAKSLVATSKGFVTIALGGVFSFTTAGGELIQQLEAFAWAGRSVYIVFDSDAATNPNVLAAEARLVDELQRKRGARCHLVRLPQDGDAKIGLDDFINTFGDDAFEQLAKAAPPLGALDAKVVALNKSVAWIEQENAVYNLQTGLFTPKDSFVNGSHYSSYKHIVPATTARGQPKEVSVAATWLKHSHAQRFSQILFRPGEGVTVQGETGGAALNMWRPIDTTPGDVQPFFDLTDYVFSRMRPEDMALPLKLIAYKAQNPAEKIPLAIIMVGPQGGGKSLWAETVRDAFSPYGANITPKNMSGEFQDWLEKSLIGLINEADGHDMRKASETIKALVSDLQRNMNVKFRPARDVNTYTFYIITSNKRGAAAFEADDRRWIVVDVPKMREQAFYDRFLAWRRDGGCKKLMHWLLNVDLQGWKPPQRAPLSAEKYLSYQESLSPIQKLADDMRNAPQGMIRFWLDQAIGWAQAMELSNNAQQASLARATIANVGNYQIRPWYTPEELALMFPAIVEQTLGSKYNPYTPAGTLSRELRDAGVPYLVSADDPRGFWWRGQLRQYLVVSDFDEWTSPIRQADFERLMGQWPTYAQTTGARR